MRDQRPSRREFLAASAAASLAWRSGATLSSPVSAEGRPAAGTDLAGLTLKGAADLIRGMSVSPVELTQACLDRIERYNPALNAFITVTGDQALALARDMQAEQQRGKWRGPLHGVPIALKDNIDTAGVRTTGASELFENRVPTEDAEVARRLKQAGAILLGKLNLHEFAYGGSSTVTHFGTMHNPWAFDHVTGGSSGGPAVAVSADLCFGSIGTDTAGSVRMPASQCGIVGLKPTYGRVSTRGVMTLSWTLDHVGPMCKTVEDAALMLSIIAGYDDLDPTTVDVAVPDYMRALKTPTSKLRLGIPRRPFFDGLDPEVERASAAALEVLKKLTSGSTLDVVLPPSGNPATIWGPEALVYHAKGIAESPEKYQPGTRAALQRSIDAKATDYVRARRQVEVLRREIKGAFTSVDVLITPTMKMPAPLLGSPGAAGGGNNNAAFDVFGLPTISIPIGFSAAGLPIGLQITGAPFAESTVLALAHAYEQATDWHTRKPPLNIG